MSALAVKGRRDCAPSGQAGRVVMTLTALKRPAPTASRIPRLTPGDSAKSSAQRQKEKRVSTKLMMVSRVQGQERPCIPERNSLASEACLRDYQSHFNGGSLNTNFQIKNANTPMTKVLTI